MSTFFPRSPAIDSAVSTSSSALFVLVEQLTSLLFFSSGEKASEEEDLGRSFLFAGIELQRITYQKVEHRRHVLTPWPFPAFPQDWIFGSFMSLCGTKVLEFEGEWSDASRELQHLRLERTLWSSLIHSWCLMCNLQNTCHVFYFLLCHCLNWGKWCLRGSICWLFLFMIYLVMPVLMSHHRWL